MRRQRAAAARPALLPAVRGRARSATPTDLRKALDAVAGRPVLPARRRRRRARLVGHRRAAAARAARVLRHHRAVVGDACPTGAEILPGLEAAGPSSAPGPTTASDATPGGHAVSGETATEPAPPADAGAGTRGRRGPRTSSTAIVGVIGELLITLGVLLFGFLVWQLWWTDVHGNRAQAEIVREMRASRCPPRRRPPGRPRARSSRRRATTSRPVLAEPSHATTFATMQVPRWDGEPERPISEGTDRATVLDVLGVGPLRGDGDARRHRQLRRGRPPHHVRQAVQPGRRAAEGRPADRSATHRQTSGTSTG